MPGDRYIEYKTALDKAINANDVVKVKKIMNKAASAEIHDRGLSAGDFSLLLGDADNKKTPMGYIVAGDLGTRGMILPEQVRIQRGKRQEMVRAHNLNFNESLRELKDEQIK